MFGIGAINGSAQNIFATHPRPITNDRYAWGPVGTKGLITFALVGYDSPQKSAARRLHPESFNIPFSETLRALAYGPGCFATDSPRNVLADLSPQSSAKPPGPFPGHRNRPVYDRICRGLGDSSVHIDIECD